MEAWPAHPHTWDLPAFWVSPQHLKSVLYSRELFVREKVRFKEQQPLGSCSQGQRAQTRRLPAPAARPRSTQLALTPGCQLS